MGAYQSTNLDNAPLVSPSMELLPEALVELPAVELQASRRFSVAGPRFRAFRREADLHRSLAEAIRWVKVR